MIIWMNTTSIRMRSVLANREYIKFFRKFSVFANRLGLDTKFTKIGNVLAIRDGHYVY